MAKEPCCHVFHSLHQQLCQPSAVLLRGQVLHPARGAGVHGALVRGHRAGLGYQEEPTEQPEQSGKGQGCRCHHAKGIKIQTLPQSNALWEETHSRPGAGVDPLEGKTTQAFTSVRQDFCPEWTHFERAVAGDTDPGTTCHLMHPRVWDRAIYEPISGLHYVMRNNCEVLSRMLTLLSTHLNKSPL